MADDQHNEPDEADPEQDEDGPAIRKQVEFYFSDENLVHDAHLLGLCGGAQNVPVSISRICGFRKMRQYKPVSRVRAALERSSHLVVTDPKHVKRRFPLTKDLRVKPAVDFDCNKNELLNKPWLTAALLKPTGFEPNFADAPISPEDHARERECYHPSLSFHERIETAIQRYRARRKLHQQNAMVLGTFLEFGGIETGPRPFTGGLTKHDLEDKTANEKAQMTATDFVPDHLISQDKWVVDFSGVAKGFLSTSRVFELGFAEPGDIPIITNVMLNFYRYILYHDVCPEYKADIFAAQDVCIQANDELVKAFDMSDKMPDGFNSACSVLFGGNYAGVYSTGQDWDGADNLGWSAEEARTIFLAAVAVHGTAEQYRAVHERAQADDQATPLDDLKTAACELLGLQVTQIMHPDAASLMFYNDHQIRDTHLTPLGKIVCHRLTPDLSGPEESSNHSMRTITIWIEESILAHCFVGMKMEAEVRTLDIGVSWLDSVRSFEASFHKVLPNEIFDRKCHLGLLPREYLKRLRTIYKMGWKDQEQLLAEANVAEGVEDAELESGDMA